VEHPGHQGGSPQQQPQQPDADADADTDADADADADAEDVEAIEWQSIDTLDFLEEGNVIQGVVAGIGEREPDAGGVVSVDGEEEGQEEGEEEEEGEGGASEILLVLFASCRVVLLVAFGGGCFVYGLAASNWVLAAKMGLSNQLPPHTPLSIKATGLPLLDRSVSLQHSYLGACNELQGGFGWLEEGRIFSLPVLVLWGEQQRGLNTCSFHVKSCFVMA